MTYPDYDVYLGDKASMQGYRCRQFVRDSAPQIAPRFSSGAAGETDLDLLKSASVRNFAGGMFQRDWDDDQRVARAIGAYNQYDNQLYPTPPISGSTALTSGYGYLAKVEEMDIAFLAVGTFATPNYVNQIKQVTAGGGVTNLALPATLASNINANISGMCLHKGFLYVASALNGSRGVQRYNLSSLAWQDIGSVSVIEVFSMRNVLYAINRQNDIYSVTNEVIAGTATFTLVDSVGLPPQTTVYDIVQFNGAAWIHTTDGIYRFDGISAVRVLRLKTQYMQPFKGALYFYSGNWLYRFDGTNLEMIQFFGSQETFNSLSADSDYLYVTTGVATSGYSSGDKVAPSATGLKRLYSYDGASWFLRHESDETAPTALEVIVNSSYIYMFMNKSGSFTWRTLGVPANDYSLTAVTTTHTLEATTSEHDDGFPNIFKSFELCEVEYTGITTGDILTVSYQLYDGLTWGAWNTLGTITSTSSNRLEVTDFDKKLYKKIKINVKATLAAASTLALGGVSFRYTLQPRVRWRWQASLMAEGNGSIEDRNGDPITTQANALNNVVTKAIKQKTPIFLFSPDYGSVKTTVNAAAITFNVGGQFPIYTDPYNEYPLVAIKNASDVWEIVQVLTATYDSNNAETTLTLKARGYLGITAAQLTAGNEVRLCYKVYVNRLVRDNAILQESSYKQQTTGESQLEREFLLEITEV